MPASLANFAAKPVDPNKALRIARAADYPKEVWYFLASFIFLVSSFHFGSILFCRRRKPYDFKHGPSGSETASEDSSSEGDRTQKASAISLRRMPQAVAAMFRISVFRFTVSLGGGLRANLAEVSVVIGYLLALLTWEFIYTKNLTTHQPLDITYWANRAATLAASQTTLIVALAGKNNIISLLTGISYEKLNILHRSAARVVLLMVWIHAWGRWRSGFVADLSLDHSWLRGGILAASSYTLLIIISVRPLRNAAYELFFYCHLVLVSLSDITFPLFVTFNSSRSIILFAAYFHMQQIAGFGHYVWPALSVWALDRVLRLCRILFFNLPFLHAHTSPSTVEILSADALRLTIRRRHIAWRPGQSMFLILPEVSRLPFESHPFTISSINTPAGAGETVGEKELVFLIRARSGLTGRLRDVARDTSGSSVNVIVDGPYGSPPDLSSFSTVVLIAGGSGVSYCLPLFTDLIRQAREGKAACRRIVFVWSVRVPTHVRWISKSLLKYLLEVPAHVQVEIRIQVTGLASSDIIPTLEKTPGTPLESDDDLSTASPKADKEHPDSESALLLKMPGVKMEMGRADVRRILDDEISCASGPVSVDVCGPVGLSDTVRSALKSDMAGPMGVLKGRASVTLHVERFGIA